MRSVFVCIWLDKYAEWRPLTTTQSHHYTTKSVLTLRFSYPVSWFPVKKHTHAYTDWTASPRPSSSPQCTKTVPSGCLHKPRSRGPQLNFVCTAGSDTVFSQPHRYPVKALISSMKWQVPSVQQVFLSVGTHVLPFTGLPLSPQLLVSCFLVCWRDWPDNYHW